MGLARGATLSYRSRRRTIRYPCQCPSRRSPILLRPLATPTRPSPRRPLLLPPTRSPAPSHAPPSRDELTSPPPHAATTDGTLHAEPYHVVFHLLFEHSPHRAAPDAVRNAHPSRRRPPRDVAAPSDAAPHPLSSPQPTTDSPPLSSTPARAAPPTPQSPPTLPTTPRAATSSAPRTNATRRALEPPVRFLLIPHALARAFRRALATPQRAQRSLFAHRTRDCSRVRMCFDGWWEVAVWGR